MQGYYVVTQESNDAESKSLLDLLAKSGLINVKHTRAFNRLTDGVYKTATTSAVNSLRNRKEEQRQRRKEYNSRPEVKERMKEYNQLPETKERKRRERERKKKLLKKIPREVILEVLKEEQAEKTTE